MFFTILFVVLAAETAWKFHQLSRAPQNRGVRWLTLCVVCAVATYALAIRHGTQGIDGTFGVGTAKLLMDTLFMGMTYSLMLFYLYSTGDTPAVRRRARRERVGFLAAVTGIVATAVAPPHHTVLHSTFEDADMTVPRAALFYLGIGLYALYALAASCRRTHRFARMSSGAEAVGLWTASAGLLGLAASTGIRSVFVVVRSQGGAVPAWLSVSTGILLVVSLPAFVLGVTWPGVRSRCAAWRLRREHRRIHRELKPLWRLLSSVYPDTVLPRAGRGGRAGFRYARRVIECRDGLVRISPHLSSVEPVLESMAPKVLAERLHHAAEAVRRGQVPSRPGTPLALSRNGDTAEVEQLVVLSRALHALSAPTS
ncbi:MAB_1171c family putative transporter [Streptomyces sp. NPDC047071]|uniref:MAB_1171c family putative transporter n=1 Tax=Streptomyces sp. NPDC047071 TaxID=3154808 RepID=UPI003452B1CA